MAATVFQRRAGNYGLDAPYAALGLAAGAVVCLVFCGVLWTRHGSLLDGAWPGAWGIVLLLMAGSFVYTTRRGKFVVWQRLIDELHLQGNEQVLDLGCGRGLVLLEVARHLTSGRAVGLDLWRSLDQSGNSEGATRDNAKAEGVADRVELRTGDMTKLPFDDASFDVIVSSLAVHNIPTRQGRLQAIDEAARVLRPGGRLRIADFRHTRAYAARLRERGMDEVARRSLGWRFWYGGPPWATHLVSAVKPGAR